MSDFNRATEKISIGSLDDHKISVTAQYNPKEVEVDMNVPWQKVNQTNKSNISGIHLEFTGAEAERSPSSCCSMATRPTRASSRT
jgi:hypothetical protein